ncbi:MAG: RDD family protein [Acidimicrobiales bacterium]
MSETPPGRDDEQAGRASDPSSGPGDQGPPQSYHPPASSLDYPPPVVPGTPAGPSEHGAPQYPSYGQSVPEPGYGPPGGHVPPASASYPDASGQAGWVLAGWWRRLGGALIDGIIIAVVAVLFGLAFRHQLYVGLILAEVAQLVYLVLMIGSRGQTLGMMVVGVQLHDARTGSTAIGYRRALLRAVTALVIELPSSLGLPLAGILPLLNYLWPTWDRKNQTWHDKAAGTIAVRV